MHVRAPAGAPAALLVVLPGYGVSAAETERTSGLDPVADAHRWLVAYPDELAVDGDPGSWDAGICCGDAARSAEDDVAFVADLANRLRHDHPSPRRAPLVVGGFSNGAMLTAEVLCRRPGLVDGAVLMAGNLEDPGCTSLGAREVLVVRGAQDPTVPITGGYNDVLGVTLLPDRVLLAALAYGHPCRRVEAHRTAVYDYRRAVCGPTDLVEMTEQGQHSWLPGSRFGSRSTSALVASLVTRLQRH